MRPVRALDLVTECGELLLVPAQAFPKGHELTLLVRLVAHMGVQFAQQPADLLKLGRPAL